MDRAGMRIRIHRRQRGCGPETGRRVHRRKATATMMITGPICPRPSLQSVHRYLPPKDALWAVPGGHTDEAIGDRTRGGARGPAAGSGGAGACGRKR